MSIFYQKPKKADDVLQKLTEFWTFILIDNAEGYLLVVRGKHPAMKIDLLGAEKSILI